jgi:hypothetical protein
MSATTVVAEGGRQGLLAQPHLPGARSGSAPRVSLVSRDHPQFL